MRLSQPSTLLSLLFAILSSTHTFAAPQNARDRELFQRQYHYLSERSCAGQVCGWSGQLCCASGQACSTNSAGQAGCIASTNAQRANAQENQWQYYTTTYVETDLLTVTSTYSSYFGAETRTAAAVAAVTGTSCDSSMNESPCGTICCAVGQYCAYAGQCAASNGNGVGSSSLFNMVAPTIATTTIPAAIRPTSNVITTTTSTGSMTTTVPFVSASAQATGTSVPGMTATTANNGLSGGAIAGIVIGVILAILFLLLICAFFCCKGLIDGILGFFGLRNRRRREETYIEERRSHHASGGGGGRRWFGAGGPARVQRTEKKSSGIGGFTTVAAALGALAILLGLKRKRDERKAKTEYSESEYTYSDTYSSESE